MSSDQDADRQAFQQGCYSNADKLTEQGEFLRQLGDWLGENMISCPTTTTTVTPTDCLIDCAQPVVVNRGSAVDCGMKDVPICLNWQDCEGVRSGSSGLQGLQSSNGDVEFFLSNPPKPKNYYRFNPPQVTTATDVEFTYGEAGNLCSFVVNVQPCPDKILERFPRVGFDSVSVASATQAALETAIASANGREVNLQGMTITISDWVTVNSGVKTIRNGSLIMQSGAANGMFLLQTTGGASKDVLFQDLEIDMNNSGARVFYGQNASDIGISRVNAVNIGEADQGMLMRAFNGGPDIENICVDDSSFIKTVAIGTNASNNNVQIGGLTTGDAIDLFTDGCQSVATDAIVRDVSVTNTTITGGRYGLGLTAIEDSVFENNTISGNVRNISMQALSSNNIVRGNSLLETSSAAMHVAYFSSNNLIENNTIRSSICVGQALLNAYTKSDNNIFRCNDVEVTSAPIWMAYSGISSGNQFLQNRLVGPYQEAAIGIESGWQDDSGYGATYANHYNLGGVWGCEDATRNVVKENYIDAQGGLTQIMLAAAAGQNLTGTQVLCNTIVNAGDPHILYINESSTGGLVTQVEYEENIHPAGATAAMFNNPRGAAHYSSMQSQP